MRPLWSQYYTPKQRSFRALVSCSAILNENEFMNTYTSQQDPYDQYEVAIPIEVVGDCMAKVQSSLATKRLPGISAHAGIRQHQQHCFYHCDIQVPM